MTPCQVTPPAVFSIHSFSFQTFNPNNLDFKNLQGFGLGKRGGRQGNAWNSSALHHKCLETELISPVAPELILHNQRLPSCWVMFTLLWFLHYIGAFHITESWVYSARITYPVLNQATWSSIPHRNILFKILLR